MRLIAILLLHINVVVPCCCGGDLGFSGKEDGCHQVEDQVETGCGNCAKPQEAATTPATVWFSSCTCAPAASMHPSAVLPAPSESVVWVAQAPAPFLLDSEVFPLESTPVATAEGPLLCIQASPSQSRLMRFLI